LHLWMRNVMQMRGRRKRRRRRKRKMMKRSLMRMRRPSR
uniref:DUF1713 domain-containing protein n=1 Tax=Mesocestoides corti TaxID=53468 RepID=A0A0R3UDA3_MESCO